MRVRAGLLALVALLLLPGTVAAVGKPTREPAPSPATFEIEGVCDFTVVVEVLTDRVYTTTFYDAEGNVTRILSAGALAVRLSHGENSVSLNISGPGLIIPDETGITLVSAGPWFLIVAGEMFFLRGLGEFRFEENSESIVDIHGNRIDLCEVLA